MTKETAIELQTRMAKEALALLTLHPNADVQLYRESITLIGAAWGIPAKDKYPLFFAGMPCFGYGFLRRRNLRLPESYSMLLRRNICTQRKAARASAVFSAGESGQQTAESFSLCFRTSPGR